MATMAELAEARDAQDRDMILMIHQGKTASQIAEMLGLTASTVRNRAERVGLKCESVHRRGPVPKRIQTAARPCRHKPAECKSMSCLGHRFGPDLTCQCGVEWHQHQREGLPCEIGVPVEQLDVEQLETCLNGHDISRPDSVYTYPSGRKNCRACRTEWELRSRRKKAERGGVVRYRPDPDRKYCANGHPWTDVYRNPNGKEQCRVCRREQHRKYSANRREGK